MGSSRGGALGPGILALLLLLSGTQAQVYQQMPKNAPCFTGVAQLELVSDDCQDDMARMAPLSRPFNPSTQLPWDCLSSMVASVEGCKVSMASLVNVSQQLFNFSCNLLEFQGLVVNESTARVAAWVRPLAVARYMLRHTDLDSLGGDQQGAAKPKPADWQDQLLDMFGNRGNAMVSVDERFVVLQQNDRRCNTTWEVVSGGMLGAGTVNASSVGQLVVPSGRPFSQPFIVRAERPRPWAARARGVFIALVVIVSLLGAALLAALGYLFFRLFRAASSKAGGVGPMRGSPFEDGLGHVNGGAGGAAAAAAAQQHHQAVGGLGRTGSSFAEADHQVVVGVGSLEHSARRHGTSGGL